MEVGRGEAMDGAAVMRLRIFAERKQLGIGKASAIFDERAGAVELPGAEPPFLFVGLTIRSGGDGDGNKRTLAALVGGDAGGGSVDLAGVRIFRARAQREDVRGFEVDGFFFPRLRAVVGEDVF